MEEVVSLLLTVNWFAHIRPIKVCCRPCGSFTCTLHALLHARNMERKVAQTELEPSEYQTLAKTAEKKGLTIKEALRQAARLWVHEESGIDPNDPIFDIALGRRKAKDWGKGTENASKEVDETLYK